MSARGLIKKSDKGLFASSLILVVIGLVSLYSLGHHGLGATGGNNPYFIQQLAWEAIAFPVCIGCWLLNYKLWDRFVWLLYIFNIIFLVLLLIIGRKISGASSWFSLGIMRFQPSEFAKILFIVTFAGYLSRYRQNLRKLNFVALAFLQFLIPFGLILIQPDMGTAMVFVMVFYGMIYVAGVDGLTIFVSLVVFASGAIAASPYVLKGYQFKRLTAFLSPETDPLGAGYQLIQSKVAIGSGGMLGKGIFHGTQAALGFLPTAHSDFVFSTFAEQTGYIGGLAVILLFAWFLFRVVKTGSEAEDLFAMYIAAGVFCMIAFQSLINIGMTLGVFPITGIPLPFMSYGGSSLLMNSIAVGILLNISTRRRKIMFV